MRKREREELVWTLSLDSRREITQSKDATSSTSARYCRHPSHHGYKLDFKLFWSIVKRHLFHLPWHHTSWYKLLLNSTNTQTGTSTTHSALIRSLATFTDKTSSISYIVSTGEDKQLVVSSLPTLEQVSKRELLKRANALDVTDEGEIIIGDKFGDVYL